MQSPWRAVRTRQDLTEELYLRISLMCLMHPLYVAALAALFRMHVASQEVPLPPYSWHVTDILEINIYLTSFRNSHAHIIDPARSLLGLDRDHTSKAATTLNATKVMK
jgi:hypothetical protein